ncbi:helix-turn-helix domain-containing protein [Maribacter caenipelagi]|uniref:helix-turn-helix domain-containing protein n=1 Tax=Maribacter caenipelagi TaxID=1447781 RepID=UPI00105C953A|nr:helix-turn-helix domain-containing protein [Maribacter caenipelagi]
MSTKNYLLLFILFLLLPFYATPLPIVGNLIACNQASVTLSTKQINEYTAEDFYILGVCEYKDNNFEKAYDYFISAKSLGFANVDSLQTYINDCRKHITNTSGNEGSILKEGNQLEANNYKHKVQVYLLNIIFILIACVGLITSFFLAYKYRAVKSNIFLGVFLFAISLALIELVLYWQDFFLYAPSVSIYRVLFFLWAPSLYLYLKTKYKETLLSRKEIILHYLPFFLVLASLIIFGNYYDTYNVQDNIFLNGLDIIMNSNWIKAVHLSAYLVLIIADFENKNKQMDHGFKNWILTLIVFIVILILFIIARAAFEHIYVFDYISKYFIAVYLILFITVLEILLVVQPNIVLGTIGLEPTNKPKDKYKNSSLTENMSIRVKDQLLDALINDKIYLDNNLTLIKLAKKINVDRYSLSQVINQELDKNFYELINDYRISEAVRIIASKPKKQVVDLIYECGFNNKVSFYKAFKKRMQMTPKEYIEKHIIEP